MTAAALQPADLAEVLQAYSAVAERLQASHETLQNQVAQLHRELAAKNAQLERSKRLSALGEMAAGIAHEIRNPLAAIQLYAEMVADDLTPARRDPRSLGFAADNTAKIASAVRGLSAIVNDVLSFARQLEPRTRPLDPRPLIQRVLDAHRPALEAHGIAVDLRVDTPTLHADPDLLHQALLNLVRNATDAMAPPPEDAPEEASDQNPDFTDQAPDQTPAPRRLSLAVSADQIVVADTGPGLPDHAAERIFNPFFTTRSTGTGLGLAIVHRIVDAHGGAISVQNHPDHGGAVFTLKLPAPPTPDGPPPPSGSDT
ncbi:MAG: ATP-binding protein [Planctomycetota bacterium]